MFALLVVPDRDDATNEGVYDFHVVCGVMAAYFLLSAIVLGLRSSGWIHDDG